MATPSRRGKVNEDLVTEGGQRKRRRQGQMSPQLRKRFGAYRLSADFGLLGIFHGSDQPGQPKPAACLASPGLVLPFWPHCLPRLHGGEPLGIIPCPPTCSDRTPERIRGDVICFTQVLSGLA